MSTGPVRRGVFAVLPLVLCLLPSALGADIDKPEDGAPSADGFKPLASADRVAEPLLAPASNEGEARIKQFKMAPGLKVDLWAAEPMLANPVAFSVDERGRVYTSETYRYRSSVLDIRHYMFMLEDDLSSRSIEDRMARIRKWFGPEGEAALGRETEVIRLLEDTDGDHRADKSSVFADGFTSPLSGIASGVLARRGEVWFAEIPSLWRFRPEAGSPAYPAAVPAEHLKRNTSTPLASTPRVMDGHKAEELLRGFGVRFSFTGHDLHGLKFGPDGRLYFSCGDRGAHIVTREGTVIDLPDEGAVFRCEPDGSKLEVVHRGLRNPQELAFDEYGDLFTGDNDSDQGDRERWVQVVEGADSGWRVGHQHAPLGNAGMWNMERLWVPRFEGQAAYILPPVANIGDGPSGLVYEYGTGLPPGLKGRFLLAYFKGASARSGIVSLKLRAAGAGHELVAHDEFVWNSLVPDVDIAPDGSIFFADWHEGWPKSNKGRLYRAYFPEVVVDPAVKRTATMLAEGFARRGEDELLALLGHHDMRVRQEAQFELAARGPGAFEGLIGAALEARPLPARLHALRAIGQIARTRPTNAFADELFAVLGLAKDPEPEVRREMARVVGEGRLLNAGRALAGMLADANPRVRAAAAMGLAKLADAPAYRVALSPGRKLVRAAGKKAVALAGDYLKLDSDFGQKEVLALLAADAGKDPVLGHAGRRLLLALIRKGNRRVLQDAMGPDRPAAVRMAALLALRGLASPQVAEFLADPGPLLVLEAARAINDVPVADAMPALAALAEPAKIAPLLKQFAALKPSPPPVPAADAIRDLRADQPLPWSNAPIDHLEPMLLRVVNANFRVGTPGSAGRLAAMAANNSLPGTIRTEALAALGSWATPPARDRIVGVYRPLSPRDAAPGVEALRPRLAELLKTAPEAVRTAAALAAADLQIGDADGSLLGVVKDTTAPAAVRAAALRSLARLKAPSVGEALRLAAADAAEPLRLAASKLDAELNPDGAVGQLAAKLASGSLAEQQSAYASLGELKSDSADALLAEALDRLMRREVADEAMLDLVEAAAKRSSASVKTRLAAYQDWKLPKDHLSPYREALSGGVAVRGRKIFYEHAAVACTRCHQIGGDSGGNAGPKLDGLAAKATREHLLESVVFPNRQIAQGYESSMITTRTGTVYAGVVKSEDDATLVVATPDEGDVRLAKAEVKSRERGVSGMPEGFGELLTRFELRDVVEFLGTLR